MVLWDYLVSFFKDDSESIEPHMSQQDDNKENEDVDLYTNSVHKLKFLHFCRKKMVQILMPLIQVDALQWQEQLRLVMLKL